MKASETVKTASELCILVGQEYRTENLEAKDCYGLDCEVCQLTKQAEISYQVGIKEVVDFATNYLLSSVYDGSPNRLKWQAKLKEWGIEK